MADYLLYRISLDKDTRNFLTCFYPHSEPLSTLLLRNENTLRIYGARAATWASAADVTSILRALDDVLTNPLYESRLPKEVLQNTLSCRDRIRLAPINKGPTSTGVDSFSSEIKAFVRRMGFPYESIFFVEAHNQAARAEDLRCIRSGEAYIPCSFTDDALPLHILADAYQKLFLPKGYALSVSSGSLCVVFEQP